MSRKLPSYYTSLGPFAELFAEGVPMLMYHKLGPRPMGVRMRGLYVSRALFERQLAGLREAGFTTGAYGAPVDDIRASRRATRKSASPQGNAGKRIVLTFDDGFSNVLTHGLEPLARHGFRAIEFLVGNLLGGVNEWEIREGEVREPLMDAGQVREWITAGHEIGSHTLTHPFLTRISPARAREEVLGSKKLLEDKFGVAIRHFCYPYGDWNPAVRDLVIEAGYATACTTEFGVNTGATPAFELKRITARYQSISFKALGALLNR
jgi:peptidoglycan/xylan/chitin deacetylase (PgdA/CDA1 family)